MEPTDWVSTSTRSMVVVEARVTVSDGAVSPVADDQPLPYPTVWPAMAAEALPLEAVALAPAAAEATSVP